MHVYKLGLSRCSFLPGAFCARAACNNTLIWSSDKGRVERDGREREREREREWRVPSRLTPRRNPSQWLVFLLSRVSSPGCLDAHTHTRVYVFFLSRPFVALHSCILSRERRIVRAAGTTRVCPKRSFSSPISCGLSRMFMQIRWARSRAVNCCRKSLSRLRPLTSVSRPLCLAFPLFLSHSLSLSRF